MVPKPDIAVECNEDVFLDNLGQRWSPATVTIQWPSVSGLRSPVLTCDVISLARGEMSADHLAAAHIQSMRDVLSAALRVLDDPAHRCIFERAASETMLN